MKENPSTPGSLKKLLNTYGTVSLAVAAAAVPQAARADVVYLANPSLTTTVSNPSLYFNLTTGYIGTTAETVTSGPNPDFELFDDINGLGNKPRLLAGTNTFSSNRNQFAVTPFSAFAASSSVARLAPGALIGNSLKFGNSFRGNAFNTLAANSSIGGGQHLGHWNPGVSTPATGDLGLLVVRAGQTYYGWANIQVNSDYSITLNSFGYNPVAGAVDSQTGETPEPASIVLLALGAAGIAAYRRKNSKTPA